MMRVPVAAVCAVTALAAADATAQIPGLTLEIANGRVTLDARDVPVNRILEQWARVRQVTIVNGEALAGTRVTLRLESVPEREALAVLLRSASGYILGRRAGASAGSTEIDRIFIVRPSAPSAQAAAARPDGRTAARVTGPRLAAAPDDGAPPRTPEEAAAAAGIPPAQAAGLSVEQIELLQKPNPGVFSGEGPANQSTRAREAGDAVDGASPSDTSTHGEGVNPPTPSGPQATPGVAGPGTTATRPGTTLGK